MNRPRPAETSSSAAPPRDTGLRRPPVPAVVILSFALALLAALWQLDAAMDTALARVTAAPPTDDGSGDQGAPSPALAYPFQTLPVGSALPTDAQCTAIMDQHRSPSFEPRPENTEANHTNVYAAGYRF